MGAEASFCGGMAGELKATNSNNSQKGFFNKPLFLLLKIV